MSEKKVSTSSFSIEKPGRLNRMPSLQMENKLDHQPSAKFAGIVDNALRRFNESQNNYRWDLERLEEKRRLHGLKLKMRWRDLTKKYTLVVKMCVPNNFDNIRATRIYDPDDFILQIESVNFEMQARQLKSLQRFLDNQMKSHIKEITIKGANEDDWLLHIMENLSQRMVIEEKSEFKDKREILKEEPIVKSLVNENYIICPSPIAIAWNPQGQLTISEHRTIPRVKGAYIGNRRFLNFAFESSKSSSMIMSKEDNELFQLLVPEIIEMDESIPASIYNWTTEENLDFMDKEVAKVQNIPSPGAFEDEQRKYQHQKKLKSADSKKSDVMLLVDLTKTSPELAKFYKSHFNKQTPPEHQQHNEKIRTYRIDGPDKELENELLFLLYRIGQGKDRNVIESVLKTELAGYMKIFDQQQQYDPIQYLLIRKLLSEKLKLHAHLPLYLKAMMVENEVISQLLSRWFTAVAQRLPLGPGQQKSLAALNGTLGSYLHFEYLKCQEILMELLKAATFKPFKPELSGRFVIKTNSYLMPFEPEFIISEAEAVDFYRRIIPILELRNRNASYLEYRKIMRIILANDQLKNFVRIMNQFIELHRATDPASKQFLLQLVGAYGRRDQQLAAAQPFIRRQYRLECLRCHSINETYELPVGQIKCQYCCPVRK